ncbi:GDSL-type esterase/lipase family protein [Planococcus maritimus]|uniref:GDSL-type esterase/lipase family protein n=1 Tax=Planococcus maritimus TaxID=192421 RepID=UPI00313A3C28
MGKIFLTKGGIARHLADSFPDSEVLNFGINGLTSDGLVERLRAGHWREELAQADVVLLNIGGNDLLRQYQEGGASELVRQFVPLKRKYRRNLLDIYGAIQQNNKHVLIVQNSLYNSMKKEAQYFGFTNLLFHIWNSAIGSNGILVTNTRKMGKVPSIWLDSIHPNEEGYAIMHQLLLETLQTTGITIAKERQ